MVFPWAEALPLAPLALVCFPSWLSCYLLWPQQGPNSILTSKMTNHAVYDLLCWSMCHLLAARLPRHVSGGWMIHRYHTEQQDLFHFPNGFLLFFLETMLLVFFIKNFWINTFPWSIFFCSSFVFHLFFLYICYNICIRNIYFWDKQIPDPKVRQIFSVCFLSPSFVWLSVKKFILGNVETCHWLTNFEQENVIWENWYNSCHVQCLLLKYFGI